MSLGLHLASRTYSQASHAFYDSLVAFIAATAALGTSFEVQAGHPSKPYASGDYITLQGFASLIFHAPPIG
jgi:hypothetical protein